MATTQRMMVVVMMVAAAAVMVSAAPEAERIASYPSFDGSAPFVPPSAHYSGYLNVGPNNETHLHYLLQMYEGTVTAETPVVVWQNGGPGCSSMDGAFYEMGATRLSPQEGTANISVTLNPNRWTLDAIYVALEAPAGVGFSYTDNTQVYSANDTGNAELNAEAVAQLFSDKFPELARNPLFLMGESYAGIYVPTLALAIHNRNQDPANFKVNLVGVSTGNGCAYNDATLPGAGPCSGVYTWSVDFLHGHGLYQDSLYTKIKDTCKDPVNPDDDCTALLQMMGEQVGRANIYNIYDQCVMSGGGEAEMSPEALRSRRGRRIPHRPFDEIMEVSGPVGCIDGNAAHAYLNQPEARAALHVAGTDDVPEWEICSSRLFYSSNVDTVVPIYQNTLIDNYRVWIYSGNVDACVPYIATEAWTSGLGRAVTKPWHAWYTPSEFGQQVAGYTTSYKGGNGGDFSFVTVHGSGHMVPQDPNMGRPVAALEMFRAFISGQTL